MPERLPGESTNRLCFHHVGCAVKSIAEAVEAYRPMALSVSPEIPITAQGVKVCFVEISPGSFIELVEAATEDSLLRQMIKKGITYYHTGYLTEDFDGTLEQLDAAGFRHINTFHSEAFEQRRCAFLASPVAHLIEIIESKNRCR
jgi:methylmalonyl-CoA/ethylmalonyl-CoA epimerase